MCERIQNFSVDFQLKMPGNVQVFRLRINQIEITVVQVLCGTECVVFGKSDFSEWCPEARLELSLASPEHPLDQYTLVSARHQIGAFGSEAQTENRQRVPVQHALGGLAENLRPIIRATVSGMLQVVVPEEDFARGGTCGHTILIWMYGQTGQLQFSLKSLFD